MSALHLARTVKTLANDHHIVIEIDPADTPRLRNAYERAGFVSARSTAGESLILRPTGEAPKSAPVSRRQSSAVIRTGRMTLPKHRASFGMPQGRGRLLDLGAGDSTLAADFLEAGHPCIACDPQYQDHGPAKGIALAAVAEALPFRSGAFEEVYASFVLMHLSDPRPGLEEVFRVIQPDGRVMVSPAWVGRRARRHLEASPVVTVMPGRLWPRRRTALKVDVTPAGLDEPTLSAIASAVSPPWPIGPVTGIAMKALIRTRGTTQVDTSGLGLRPRPCREAPG